MLRRTLSRWISRRDHGRKAADYRSGSPQDRVRHDRDQLLAELEAIVDRRPPAEFSAEPNPLLHQQDRNLPLLIEAVRRVPQRSADLELMGARIKTRLRHQPL